jgi:hypothetical protein
MCGMTTSATKGSLHLLDDNWDGPDEEGGRFTMRGLCSDVAHRVQRKFSLSYVAKFFFAFHKKLVKSNKNSKNVRKN